MSNVADQLKKLQNEHYTTQNSMSNQFSKPSLLFDGKKAARMDDQAIFDVAQDGWAPTRHLISEYASDYNIRQYDRLLFGRQSLQLDVMMQQPQEFELIKQVCRQFLVDVSPHLMQRAVVKCLEWMLRKFKVHELLSEQFLHLIMPYHATNLFVTAVQLVQPLPCVFTDLQELIRQRVAPIREVIVKCHAKNVISLITALKVVFENNTQAQAVHLPFLVVVLCELIKTEVNVVNGDLMSLIFTGLQQRADSEVQSSAVLLAMLVLQKHQLSAEYLTELCRLCVASSVATQMQVTFIAKVVESQQANVSDAQFWSELVSEQDFGDALANLLRQYDVPLFAQAVAIVLASKNCELLGKLTHELLLDHDVTGNAMSVVVKNIEQGERVDGDVQLLKQLEQQSPKLFQKLVGAGTKAIDVMLASEGYADEDRLFFMSHHHNDQVRCQALSQILSSIHADNFALYQEQLLMLMNDCTDDMALELMTHTNIWKLVDIEKTEQFTLKMLAQPELLLQSRDFLPCVLPLMNSAEVTGVLLELAVSLISELKVSSFVIAKTSGCELHRKMAVLSTFTKIKPQVIVMLDAATATQYVIDTLSYDVLAVELDYQSPASLLTLLLATCAAAQRTCNDDGDSMLAFEKLHAALKLFLANVVIVKDEKQREIALDELPEPQKLVELYCQVKRGQASSWLVDFCAYKLAYLLACKPSLIKNANGASEVLVAVSLMSDATLRSNLTELLALAGKRALFDQLVSLVHSQVFAHAAVPLVQFLGAVSVQPDMRTAAFLLILSLHGKCPNFEAKKLLMVQLQTLQETLEVQHIFGSNIAKIIEENASTATNGVGKFLSTVALHNALAFVNAELIASSTSAYDMQILAVLFGGDSVTVVRGITPYLTQHAFKRCQKDSLLLGSVLTLLNDQRMAKVFNKYEAVGAFYSKTLELATATIDMPVKIQALVLVQTVINRLDIMLQRLSVSYLVHCYSSANTELTSIITRNINKVELKESVVRRLLAQSLNSQDACAAAILELMQKGLGVNDADATVQAMFDALKLVDAASKWAEREYCLQLILAVLTHVVEKKQVYVELLKVTELVSVVKHSDNKQTRCAALTLLSKICLQHPSTVRHVISPVCQVLKSNLLNQDDRYSFLVAEEIMQNMLPQIIDDASLKAVILPLVKSLPEIAVHRRVRFYQQLAVHSGNLLLVVAFLFRTHALKGADVDMLDQDVGEFALTVALKFSYEQRVQLAKSFTVNLRLMILGDATMCALWDLKKEKSRVAMIRYSAQWLVKLVKEQKIVHGNNGLMETLLALLASSKLLSDKYCGVVEPAVIELIQAVSATVEIEQFVEVMANMLHTQQQDVHHKTLEFLVARLESGDDICDNGVASAKLVDALVNIVVDAQLTVATWTALKLVCQRFGKKLARESLVAVAKCLVGTDGLLSPDTDVQVAAMEAVGKLIATYSVMLLEYLPVMFQQSLESVVSPHQELAQAGIAALTSMLLNMAAFMTPYLPQLMTKLAGQTLESTELLQLMSEKVPVKFLLNAAKQSMQSIIDSGHVEKLADIMNLIIAQVGKQQIGEHYKRINALYLAALDSTVSDLETLVKSFTAFVLKLNETMFKPIFASMFERGAIDQNQKHRALVFYQVLNSLLDVAKDLMVPYALIAADEIVQRLVSIKLDETVIPLVVDVTRKMLASDNEGIISDNIMSSLIAPLVNQLDQAGKKQELLEKSVVPAIAQLAYSVKDAQTLKQLNTAVLQKTRSSKVQVRMVAITTLKRMYERNGDQLLAYLPETISFVSELLEDEDDRVELQCRQVIRTIEEYLGESIQEHLK